MIKEGNFEDTIEKILGSINLCCQLNAEYSVEGFTPFKTQYFVDELTNYYKHNNCIDNCTSKTENEDYKMEKEKVSWEEPVIETEDCYESCYGCMSENDCENCPGEGDCYNHSLCEEHNDVEEKHDMVNNPAHYTQGGIECIDAIEAMISSFDNPVDATLSWQVVKYVWRHPHKGKPIEDLKKAQWYLGRLINHYETGDIDNGEKVLL